MDFGVSKYGFKRKTYDDLLVECQERARQLFGDNINLSVYGIVGLFVYLLAWGLSLVWRAYEALYYQAWLDDAEGANLDKIVAFAGIEREGPKRSTVTLRFTGPNTTPIAKGKVIQFQPSKIKFETLVDATISGGFVDVQARSLTAGKNTAGIAINTSADFFADPIPDVTVTNIDTSIGGDDVETDPALRQRFKDSRALGQGSSIDGLKSKLRQVEGLLEAEIYENNEPVYDSEGRPPTHIECVVLGGSDADVATTIFKKAAGVGTFGTHSFVVVDDTGQERTIRYSRAQEKFIYVKVQATTNADWNAGSITAIKTAIIKYIGGVDTIGPNTTSYRGLSVKSKVHTWKLEGALDAIPGIDNLNILIGFASIPTTTDFLTLGIREIPRTDNAHITVEVT